MASEKLTKTLLAGLTPPAAGKRLTINDTEVPKLAVRMTHTGIKAFYVIKRADASVAWIKLGVFPDMTVENARKEAVKVLAQFATGANPAAVKRAIKEEPTFSEAVAVFLAGKRKRDGTPISDKTKRDYEDVLRLHLAAIKNKKLSAIERGDVKAIHAKVTKKGPYQADKAVALISAVFTYMLDQEQFKGLNPATRIQKNPTLTRDRFIQSDEMARFFAALAEAPNETMRDFFTLALLTGARRANVSSMAWADVDLDNASWRIAKTKNGTPQNVTLSPEAVLILKARKESAGSSPFVFPGVGKSGHIVETKTAWARLLKNAGIENLRVHDLRRTLGSWQARTGASLLVIGKSLNHKTHQATGIYARLDLDPVRQSVNTATAAMMEAAGRKDAASVVTLPTSKAA